MMTESSKGMKDAGTSNVGDVSRKPSQCVQVTTPYAGHVVEFTFRSHYSAYGLFSDTAQRSASLSYSGKNNVKF